MYVTSYQNWTAAITDTPTFVHGLRLDTSLAHVAWGPAPKKIWGLTAATCSDINSQQSKIIIALQMPACYMTSEVATLAYDTSTPGTCKEDE